jgi:hypothetical protein
MVLACRIEQGRAMEMEMEMTVGKMTENWNRKKKEGATRKKGKGRE